MKKYVGHFILIFLLIGTVAGTFFLHHYSLQASETSDWMISSEEFQKEKATLFWLFSTTFSAFFAVSVVGLWQTARHIKEWYHVLRGVTIAWPLVSIPLLFGFILLCMALDLEFPYTLYIVCIPFLLGFLLGLLYSVSAFRRADSYCIMLPAVSSILWPIHCFYYCYCRFWVYWDW